MTALAEQRLPKLKILSSDGIMLEVEQDVASLSNVLNVMVDSLKMDENSISIMEPISLIPEAYILELVFKWCRVNVGRVFKKKKDGEDKRIKLLSEDLKFLKEHEDDLFALLMAANFLDCHGLLEVITQHIANQADKKTIPELREMFNIVNDFTPVEQGLLARRFAWAEAMETEARAAAAVDADADAAAYEDENSDEW